MSLCKIYSAIAIDFLPEPRKIGRYMDEASVLQTVEDAVLNHGDHNVLCEELHEEPPTHMVTIARGSESVVNHPYPSHVLSRAG